MRIRRGSVCSETDSFAHQEERKELSQCWLIPRPNNSGMVQHLVHYNNNQLFANLERSAEVQLPVGEESVSEETPEQSYPSDASEQPENAPASEI